VKAVPRMPASKRRDISALPCAGPTTRAAAGMSHACRKMSSATKSAALLRCHFPPQPRTPEERDAAMRWWLDRGKSSTPAAADVPAAPSRSATRRPAPSRPSTCPEHRRSRLRRPWMPSSDPSSALTARRHREMIAKAGALTAAESGPPDSCCALSGHPPTSGRSQSAATVNGERAPSFLT
jgi:hypothetical protein